VLVGGSLQVLNIRLPGSQLLSQRGQLLQQGWSYQRIQKFRSIKTDP
jgi:hypothetical protein